MKFRVSTLLVTSYVLIATIVTVIILSYTRARISRGAAEVTGLWLHSISKNIFEQTTEIMHPSILLIKSLQERFDKNSAYSREDIQQALLNVIQILPNTYSAYYASMQGDFFLVAKIVSDEHCKGSCYLNKVIQHTNGQRLVTDTYINLKNYSVIKKRFRPDETYDPRQRPWFQKVIKENSNIWTSPYMFYITKKPGITYAAPIYRNNKMAGVLGTDIELDRLSLILGKIIPSKNAQIFIESADHSLVAHSNIKRFNELILQSNKLPNLSQCDDFAAEPAIPFSTSDFNISEKKITKFSIRNASFFAALSPLTLEGLKLRVGIYLPEKDITYYLHAQTSNIIAIGVLALIVTVLFGLIISQYISQPINRLSDYAKKVESLNFNTHIDTGNKILEIHETAQTLNNMVNSLQNYKKNNEELTATLNSAHLDTLYRLALAAEYKDMDTAHTISTA